MVEKSESTEPLEASGEKKGTRREIPGKLPYTATPGRLSDALKALIDAERPPKFNEGFLDGVLKMRGGSARTIPPILKKVGMLNTDNSPTEIYSQFKSDYNRPSAALTALKKGFSEIFRRNEYAHKLPDERIRDIIVEITGLPKNDGIVGSILGTFNAFKEYCHGLTEEKITPSDDAGPPRKEIEETLDHSGVLKMNLVNTINVVLPETTNVQVYNAIFKAIRENLAR